MGRDHARLVSHLEASAAGAPERGVSSVLMAALLTLCAPAAARGPIDLQWVDTRKVEQVIGDTDWATGVPTVSRTYTSYGVLANGLGYSFEHFDKAEHRRKLMFLFGDTVAFGTHSPAPGLDRNAVPVGVATSADLSVAPPPLICPQGPNDPASVPCSDSNYNYHGQDPIAWSDSRDGEAGLRLEFLMNGNLPLFVNPTDLATPSGSRPIKTGGDDIPNSGISIDGQIYIVYSTGSDATRGPAHSHDTSYSVLVRFDEATQEFKTLRQISSVPEGGHFLFTSLHALPQASEGGDVDADRSSQWILMFGVGNYRHSDVYLAVVPKSGFETGAGTRYFMGRDTNGTPRWSAPDAAGASFEREAQPLVADDAPTPSIGNVSVAYEKHLGLWLMTYDADGTNPPATRGIFLRYATEPWGSWSPPIPIFNACDNGGFGVAGIGGYIHYAVGHGDNVCNIAGANPSGSAGPMIGQEQAGGHDPETSVGATFAPLMIERFSRSDDDRLSIYYTMSTWNPYTVVKMRTDLRIVGQGHGR